MGVSETGYWESWRNAVAGSAGWCGARFGASVTRRRGLSRAGGSERMNRPFWVVSFQAKLCRHNALQDDYVVEERLAAAVA